MLILVWTALVTPFEVSFLEPDYNYLFIINRLIDTVFLIDMVFTFLMDPLNNEELKVASTVWIPLCFSSLGCPVVFPSFSFLLRTKLYTALRGLILPKANTNPLSLCDAQTAGLPDHNKMAQNYLSGWFTIDLISTIPFDLFTIVLRGGGNTDVQKLKFLRAMRLLRLVKLLRLLRVSRIFERWEDRVAINFAVLSLCKSSIGTLLCSHWIGCLWYITAFIEDAPANWVKSTSVASYSSLDDPGVTTYDKYVASWYFSVMTMSTIGYGDISPVTSAERIVCCLMMLIGAGIYAYVVGSITTTVSNMEASSRRYQELMDMLNTFLDDNNISNDLRVSSRAYMRTRQAQGNLTNWQDLLCEMSPDLREAVARETHPGWALTSRFFDVADEDFQAILQPF